jgi:hypothetical protein
MRKTGGAGANPDPAERSDKAPYAPGPDRYRHCLSDPPPGNGDDGPTPKPGLRDGNDARTGMPSGMPEGAICVQRFDDSRNSAIHITYRISLRSSSMPEPRDPLLKVLTILSHSDSSLIAVVFSPPADTGPETGIIPIPPAA